MNDSRPVAFTSTPTTTVVLTETEERSCSRSPRRPPASGTSSASVILNSRVAAGVHQLQVCDVQHRLLDVSGRFRGRVQSAGRVPLWSAEQTHEAVPFRHRAVGEFNPSGRVEPRLEHVGAEWRVEPIGGCRTGGRPGEHHPGGRGNRRRASYPRRWPRAPRSGIPVRRPSGSRWPRPGNASFRPPRGRAPASSRTPPAGRKGGRSRSRTHGSTFPRRRKRKTADRPPRT